MQLDYLKGRVVCGTVYGDMHLKDLLRSIVRVGRGKKITCPGAWDKLIFRQDKHIFSPNVLQTSKKFTDSLFFLDKNKLFGNRTSKYYDVLARGTSEIFLDFFTPGRVSYPGPGFLSSATWSLLLKTL